MAQMGFFDLFRPLSEPRRQEGPVGQDRRRGAVGGIPATA